MIPQLSTASSDPWLVKSCFARCGQVNFKAHSGEECYGVVARLAALAAAVELEETAPAGS